MVEEQYGEEEEVDLAQKRAEELMILDDDRNARIYINSKIDAGKGMF
ncbi:MAG: hypothetical protein HUJ51_06305 [Eggerthellaceae bacterium]|nr:hypothetical protein [Eggerthellaceae bacterium]